MLSKSSAYATSYLVVATLLAVFYLTGLAGQVFAGIPIFGALPEYLVLALILVTALVAVLSGAPGACVMSMATIAGFIVLTAGQTPLVRYLTLAGILFALGMYGMVVSRNAVRVLISIELMLNAANINLVAFARYVDPSQALGQLFAIFILTVAAAEAAVGLAIVLAIYRNTATVDMEKFNLLKW